MNIYVGNLPYQITEEALTALFAEHGAVSNASIIQDRETGRSKGFGFVEMDNDAEANLAIEAINGSDSGGRSLKVNEARPRPKR
ncbi:MAG: RNA recognition motif domain-containing protein [Pseudomonadales bacterium]